MANDKNFKVKNGLQAKRYLQSGSALGYSDVDVSSGSYFTKTLTANTTLTFSNPPASGVGSSFALEITGASVTVSYDLANASYDSVFGSISRDPYDITFNNDGTKLFVAAYLSSVYEYPLSTAYDLSTIGSESSKSVSSQTSTSLGIRFNNDGTTMYVHGGSENTVFQYTLSTAFDITSATYANKSLNHGTQTTAEYGFEIGDSGSKIYVYNVGDDIVYQYSMSTPYDVSTASYDSKSFDFTSQDTSLVHIKFNADGTKLYTLGAAQGNIHQYSLSSSWDISSASYDNISFSHSSQSTNAPSFTFNADGTKMYLGDDTNNRVYQYSIGSSTPATITYPSSVKWSGATTPDAPAAGEKDVYTFVTTDGGTTYYGKQAGDAVA